MQKAFRNPIFITGVPMAIFGLGVGLNHLMRGVPFGYLAFGLLSSGCTLLLIGWMQRND